MRGPERVSSGPQSDERDRVQDIGRDAQPAEGLHREGLDEGEGEVDPEGGAQQHEHEAGEGSPWRLVRAQGYDQEGGQHQGEGEADGREGQPSHGRPGAP